MIRPSKAYAPIPPDPAGDKALAYVIRRYKLEPYADHLAGIVESLRANPQRTRLPFPPGFRRRNRG